MKHIPKTEEDTVQRWVQQYQEARQLLEQISQEAWNKLRKVKE
jgi:hypothetical protein